jgi:hypothetical protein
VSIRNSVAALAAVVAVVAPAAPAAATHDEERCEALATVAPPSIAAEVCVTAVGLYDPVEVHCSTIQGCWARVTAGTHSSASIDAEVCFVVGVVMPPFCVEAGTGAIPLVPVPPQTVCVNDSPWGPPCEPHDG